MIFYYSITYLWRSNNIKEKLSKNLEQLGSYIEGLFIFLTKFEQFLKTLLDKSNVEIQRKS